MRSFSTVILEDAGHNVEQATNGREALQKIRDNPPDLVLLDIEMPEMDGIECCRQIRLDDTIRDLKIIMVTTLSEYDKITEAFKAGADDYVTKPVNPTELREKVDELLKFSEIRKLLKSQP